MQLLKRTAQLAALSVFSISMHAHADSWNCSKNDFVREVMIEYPEGSAVPCNVVYKKQTEGVEDQVLWSALNEEGYCEEKASGFIVKLESWDWVCLETVSSDITADSAAEPVQDTVSDADTQTDEVAEME